MVLTVPIKMHRKKFARLHLGTPDELIEITENGVIINDDFNVEDASSDDFYDVEGFLFNIRKKYPQARFSGEGSIDYHYSMTEYSIVDDGTGLEVIYDDDDCEYDDDCEDGDCDFGKDEDECDTSIFEQHIEKLPRIYCETSTLEWFCALYFEKLIKQGPLDVGKAFVVEDIDDNMPISVVYSPFEGVVAEFLYGIGVPTENEYAAASMVYFKGMFDSLQACTVLTAEDGISQMSSPAFQGINVNIFGGVRGINHYLAKNNLLEKLSSANKTTSVIKLEIVNDEVKCCITDDLDLAQKSMYIEEDDTVRFDKADGENASNNAFDIEGSTLTRYTGKDSVVEIPNGITEIGNGSSMTFMGTPVAEVSLPESVTSIGSYAFFKCNTLEKISLSNSIDYIGHHAFRECSNLKSIEIPDEVSVIERECFWGCTGIRSIKLPKSLTLIEEKAFSGCIALPSLEIPDGVTVIEDGAFWGDESLESIHIPASVVEIGENAFLDCSNITIFAPAGSYAETYAKENDIPFKVL